MELRAEVAVLSRQNYSFELNLDQVLRALEVPYHKLGRTTLEFAYSNGALKGNIHKWVD